MHRMRYVSIWDEVFDIRQHHAALNICSFETVPKLTIHFLIITLPAPCQKHVQPYSTT